MDEELYVVFAVKSQPTSTISDVWVMCDGMTTDVWKARVFGEKKKRGRGRS